MKEVIFESVMNRQKFRCADLRDVQVIDGVEFLKVYPQGANRTVLVRKDTLKRVTEKKK